MRTLLLFLGISLAACAEAGIQVKDVRLAPEAGGWRVQATASGKTPYTLRRYTEPDRLLIDIPDATLVGNPQVKPVSLGREPVLRFSQFSREPDVVRIVVHLPENVDRWREISAAPAMNIALFLPNGPVEPTPSVAVRPLAGPASTVKPDKKPAVAVKPAQKAAPQPVKTAAKKPESKPVKVLSAREMERQMRDNPPKKVEKPQPKPATETAARPKTTKTSAAPAAAKETIARKVTRTSVASRGAFTETGAPAAGVLGPLPPVPAPPELPVEPDWTSEEAVALIRKSDAPDRLRQRLQEIVNDPQIRTSRYVWAGESPGSFDCSGLALYVYNGLDIRLPRVSLQQSEFGQAVERENLRGGDLVFFITRGDKVSHVGIYLGEGRFLHAANPREHLKITALDDPYYATRYAGARRVYPSSVASGDSTLRIGG